MRRLGPVAALLLAVTLTSFGQQYTFRYYGSAEGLENPVVLSVAQDRTGYIWAGTEGGLYRYDGTRFHLMGEAEGLPCSTEAHGLFAASDGALWVNTCASIFRFDGQRFTAVQGLNGMLRGVQSMADANGGGILISTPSGLYEASRVADGSFSLRPYPLPPSFATRPTRAVLRRGARLWFGCDRQLCMEEAGQVSVFGRKQGLPEELWDAIQISADQSVWVRSAGKLYRRAPGQDTFLEENLELASSGFWGSLSLRRDGSILIPTDKGLGIRTSTGWTVLNRKRGLRKENTTAVLEDREGSVWIGLAGGGLARWLGAGVWDAWTMDEGLPSDIVWNIRRDTHGALWVATSLGLARINGSAAIKTWTTKNGLGGNNVRWLAATSDGSMWAAMKPGGLARINPVSGAVRKIVARDGLPCDPEDLYADRRDRLWLPTTCGLFVIPSASVSNRAVRVETAESFGHTARKVIEDKQGTLWVTNRTTLWSLREGHWTAHGRAEGLLTRNPYVMALSGDNSIWLRHRYDAGIDRLEISGDRITRVTPIVPTDPSRAEETAFHGFDAFGNFWRGSPSGAAVLHGNRWTRFTTEDGLISNDCDGEAFWADANGDVWLGTSGGLAHYHSQGPTPPESLTASPTITRLEINQSSRLIRAEFTSLNYKAEQLVRFAYRLDNGAWTNSVERSVSVTGLGPGNHRLEVRCRVRDGEFDPAVAAAEFRLEPKWQETWWARVLSVALALSGLVLFMGWRLGAAARKQAELEAIVAGRTANLVRVNRSLDEKARQLRSSEDRLKNAERLAHVGHWELDLNTKQIHWSEEMFRIWGVAQDYIPSYETSLQAVVVDDRERAERWVNDCIANGSGGSSIEFQIVRPDGDVRILSCTSEVSLDEPPRLFGACQDITESRRVQREAERSQKLESVGTLAAGIAHDFNNLLGAMVAQAELGMTKSASGLYPENELSTIMQVALRGSEIVRQLIIYAGKESEVLGPVDVSRVVTEMLELLKVLIAKRATLITDISRDLPAIYANAAQIRQIVLNLVTNACEAINGQNGTIRVSTRRLKLREGDFVELEVFDSGCGMSPETQARVFDPFFTTKSGGHGLGLAVVHGIVRGFQGQIQLSSKSGQGTSIKVLLPCSDAGARASSLSGSTAAEPAAPHQELTVLLVEDETPLRHAVAAMLRKAGFGVLEAADGTAAVALVRENWASIDVILLDVTIPGLSSHDVIEAAAERPNIRIVLTSAYNQEMSVSPAHPTQIHGFVRKPYWLRDVMQALRKAASPQPESAVTTCDG
jgi:PAS domain S-box-containing protein